MKGRRDRRLWSWQISFLKYGLHEPKSLLCRKADIITNLNTLWTYDTKSSEMYQRDPHVLFCKKNIMFTSHQKLCAQVLKLMFSEICCTGYQKGDSIFLIAHFALSGYVFSTHFLLQIFDYMSHIFLTAVFSGTSSSSPFF